MAAKVSAPPRALQALSPHPRRSDAAAELRRGSLGDRGHGAKRLLEDERAVRWRPLVGPAHVLRSPRIVYARVALVQPVPHSATAAAPVAAPPAASIATAATAAAAIDATDRAAACTAARTAARTAACTAVHDVAACAGNIAGAANAYPCGP